MWAWEAIGLHPEKRPVMMGLEYESGKAEPANSLRS